MDVVLTFFGVVAIGGAVLFLFLRRDGPRPSSARPPDSSPRLGDGRR
jgi:hypothetical protein